MLAPALLLACCTERFPSRDILDLPETPAAWVSILGEPHWHVEWLSPFGQKKAADFPPASKKRIRAEIPVTWANPVTAWPWWPEHNLTAEIFKPCGALFPYDVSGKNSDHLRLSWEAGSDTVFYQELGIAFSKNTPNVSAVKTPDKFDWLRFRELFQSDALSEAVRKDPWVVNWRSVAEKTITSNFDKRRIAAQAAALKHFPVPAGTWYGASPFAEPLFFEEGEPPVFPVFASSGINVWISEEGILRVNGNTWRFAPWENP